MGKWHRSSLRDKIRLASSVASIGRRRVLLVIYFYCILATLWFTFVFWYLEGENRAPGNDRIKSEHEKTSKKIFKEKRRKPKFMSPQIEFSFMSQKILRKEDRSRLVRTLLEFDLLWRGRLGHSYHMYSETLLGAVRHQSFNPYDDSIHLIADGRDVPHVPIAFDGTALNVVRNGPNKMRIHLKEKASKIVYLGVSFYTFLRNSTEIQDSEMPKYRLPTSLVFPTRLIPFAGSFFPAPRCYYRALEVLVGPDFLNECCFETREKQRLCLGCEAVFEFFNASLTPLAREADPVCRV